MTRLQLLQAASLCCPFYPHKVHALALAPVHSADLGMTVFIIRQAGLWAGFVFNYLQCDPWHTISMSVGLQRDAEAAVNAARAAEAAAWTLGHKAGQGDRAALLEQHKARLDQVSVSLLSARG